MATPTAPRAKFFPRPCLGSQVDGPDRPNSEVDVPVPVISAPTGMNDEENSTLMQTEI